MGGMILSLHKVFSNFTKQRHKVFCVDGQDDLKKEVIKNTVKTISDFFEKSQSYLDEENLKEKLSKYISSEEASLAIREKKKENDLKGIEDSGSWISEQIMADIIKLEFCSDIKEWERIAKKLAVISYVCLSPL